MKPTLREMGERGDIIRHLHKALKVDGLERDNVSFQIRNPASKTLSQRAVDIYLSNELGENLTLVMDGRFVTYAQLLNHNVTGRRRRS